MVEESMHHTGTAFRANNTAWVVQGLHDLLYGGSWAHRTALRVSFRNSAFLRIQRDTWPRRSSTTSSSRARAPSPSRRRTRRQPRSTFSSPTRRRCASSRATSLIRTSCSSVRGPCHAGQCCQATVWAPPLPRGTCDLLHCRWFPCAIRRTTCNRPCGPPRSRWMAAFACAAGVARRRGSGSSHVIRRVLRVARCMLRGARCMLQGTRCMLRGACCEVHVACCKVHVACCEMHGGGSRGEDRAHRRDHRPVRPLPPLPRVVRVRSRRRRSDHLALVVRIHGIRAQPPHSGKL